jgi:hypothetical protein
LLSVKLSSKSFVWTIALASGILSGETSIAIKLDLIDPSLYPAPGSRADQCPGDFIAAGRAAPMDRSVAAAVGSGDDHAKVVPAHWTVAGEIDSHIFSLTATPAGSIQVH